MPYFTQQDTASDEAAWASASCFLCKIFPVLMEDVRLNVESGLMKRGSSGFWHLLLFCTKRSSVFYPNPQSKIQLSYWLCCETI